MNRKMSLQLPTLLSGVASVASVVSALSSQEPTVPVMEASLPLPLARQMIILHTVDLKREDLTTLESYGKVVQYDVAVEGNMLLPSLQFDYLTLNLNKKADRCYFDSQDTSSCNIIAYISVIEQFDRYIDDLACSNVITSFPPRQHLKGDYDALLLKQSTDSPSKCLSLVTFMSNYLSSLKKT